MGAKGKPKTGGAVKGKSSQRAKLIEQLKASGNDGPVEVLLKEMWSKTTKKDIRRRIAEVLLPYVERKQPTEIEAENTHSFPSGIKINLIKPK